ncbi:MAG: hypothetical protein ACK4XM_12755 [Chloroherpetonaceae bacterium]
MEMNTTESIAMKVAMIGSLLSPFVEPPLVQYVVWAITAIAGIVSIVANWKRFMRSLKILIAPMWD